MIFPFNNSERLIQRMVRPIVSLLIRNGVGHRRMSELLKAVYVEVAADEYGKGGRPTNVTRISLLTGLDRKQVKEIRDYATSSLNEHESVDQNATAPSQSNVLGRVLSAWHQDERFSKNNKAMPLTVDADFLQLCKLYGGDKTSTAILNELLRVNAVERIDSNKVVAVSRYYMPAQADPEALARSFDVYRDLGNTLLHNLYRDEAQASQFEGRATNTQVPMNRVDEFRQYIEEEAQQFLEKVDARLSTYEQEGDTAEPTQRVGLGLYWIEDQKEDSK